jgi:hypothetical protein
MPAWHACFPVPAALIEHALMTYLQESWQTCTCAHTPYCAVSIALQSQHQIHLYLQCRPAARALTGFENRRTLEGFDASLTAKKAALQFLFVFAPVAYVGLAGEGALPV